MRLTDITTRSLKAPQQAVVIYRGVHIPGSDEASFFRARTTGIVR